MTDHATEQSLAEQLMENTGRHMLDSGGAYGRGFERKKGWTVESFKEKGSVYVQDEDYILINTFMWLAALLTYEPELDATFEKFSQQPIRKDLHWMGCMEEFMERLHDKQSSGIEDRDITNTYNYDNPLDEVLQFGLINTYEHGNLVILQTHNGCDVRGGYSRPRVYSIDEWEHMLMYDYTVYCNGSEEGPPQGETLPGMPDPDTDGHAVDWRDEWVDEGGSPVGGYGHEDELFFEFKDGNAVCKKHQTVCGLEVMGH